MRGAFYSVLNPFRFGGLICERTKKSKKIGELKRPGEYAGTQNCRWSFYGYPFLKIGRRVFEKKNTFFCPKIDEINHPVVKFEFL